MVSQKLLNFFMIGLDSSAVPLYGGWVVFGLHWFCFLWGSLMGFLWFDFIKLGSRVSILSSMFNLFLVSIFDVEGSVVWLVRFSSRWWLGMVILDWEERSHVGSPLQPFRWWPYLSHLKHLKCVWNVFCSISGQYPIFTSLGNLGLLNVFIFINFSPLLMVIIQ